MNALRINCSFFVLIFVLFRAEKTLHTAANMFLEVVFKRNFPEFITSYLNQDHTFLRSQNCGEVDVVDSDMLQSKL